ncbi:MAG: class I SAM-dependent methyltransferase [Desulfamplus sp.]|nr:class I SAM-dependent methyltransferase [Desulfamplus sp.]
MNQALMLSNKVKKRYKHLSKRYAKQNLDIFRLYDCDIPEIRAVVDWYAGHLVVAEYVRKNSDPLWLPIMAEATAQSLNVEMKNVHIKQRHAGYQDGNRYEKIAHTDKKIVMSERDLKFYINLDDYVDTGLFSDHRNTRLMVREMAQGKDFLNLYCYTGSFSCYAAKGGARTTVSVDRSETAIQWAKDNMELNDIPIRGSLEDIENFMISDNVERSNQRNIFIKANTFDFLEKAKKKGQMFDIAVVDPPSFSSSKGLKHHFDIAQDHPTLLKAVMDVMRKDSGSVIFFSTNHQDFKLHIDKIMDLDTGKQMDIDKKAEDYSIENGKITAIKDIIEITSTTIPEDYKTTKKQIHRCWKIIF